MLLLRCFSRIIVMAWRGSAYVFRAIKSKADGQFVCARQHHRLALRMGSENCPARWYPNVGENVCVCVLCVICPRCVGHV